MPTDDDMPAIELDLGDLDLKPKRNHFKEEIERVIVLHDGIDLKEALTDYAKKMYEEGYMEGDRVREAMSDFNFVVKTPTQRLILRICQSVCQMLLHKNIKYGDSALHPINIFSKLEAGNSICQRLDDKISRIKNSSELSENDVADLIGYLILLCASKTWTDFTKFMD